MVHVTVYLTQWLVYRQLMIKQSLSLLVMPMLVTLSGFSWSLLLISRGMILLIFAIYRGCDQLFHCPTHTAADRLDIVIKDAHEIVDVCVGTPLGTSDNCFVSCVLRVDKYVP